MAKYMIETLMNSSKFWKKNQNKNKQKKTKQKQKQNKNKTKALVGKY